MSFTAPGRARWLHSKIGVLIAQAPLSMGSISENGIQCSYHGFVINEHGICVHIPHQDTIPAAARVKAYPVVERWGFVWTWRGDKSPDESLIPQLPWTRDARRAPVYFYYYVKARDDLMADNLLDVSHADFLHRGTIGSQAGKKDQVNDVKMEMKVWNDGDLVHALRRLSNVGIGELARNWGSFKDKVTRTSTQMWQAPNTVNLKLEIEDDQNKITINHDHIMTARDGTLVPLLHGLDSRFCD